MITPEQRMELLKLGHNGNLHIELEDGAIQVHLGPGREIVLDRWGNEIVKGKRIERNN